MQTRAGCAYGAAMARYLVESFIPRARTGDAAAITARLRDEAERLTSRGTPVRLVQAIFVPDDEICFSLYESMSVDLVVEVSRRAELSCERVVEAVVR